MAFIKSKKAQSYVEAFAWQAQAITRSREPYEGDVSVDMTLYYASRRPDLDESVVLDCLQGHAYVNDRQVKDKRVRWALDKADPRAEITVSAIEQEVV